MHGSKRGEFETTTAWQTRVNEKTRATKVKDITKQIEEKLQQQSYHL